jgi:hypothetical protein
MFQQVFESETNGYLYEQETDQYMLYDKKTNYRLILKDDDALLFRQHIELMTNDTDNKAARVEKTINIYFFFNTNPCPIPNFVE